MLNRSVCFVSLLIILCACNQTDEFTILFGGDVMLDRSIRTTITKKGVSHLTAELEHVFSEADAIVVNMECPVTNLKLPLTKKFVFRADPEWLPDLRKSGITHAILANNHSYDQGREGLISTAYNLSQSDIIPIGYGTDQVSACKPIVIKRKGVSLGIFASVTLPLESWMYLEDEPGMCQATMENMSEGIVKFKTSNPGSFVIVTLHWGVEYQQFPTGYQQSMARQLIEAGADVIIGHHPHVVQRIELIDGKPVIYSIGNLIFDNPNPLASEGMLVKLMITDDRIETKLIPYSIENGRPIPLIAKAKSDFFYNLQLISDSIQDLIE